MSAPTGFLDLEDYITDWARDNYKLVHNKSKEESKLDFKEDIKLEINWKKVKFHHGEPTYHDKHIPAEPKGQVVFTTTFVNDTEEEHEYCFRTERTTKSTCEIEMSKGVTTGMEMELALKTPCEVFEMHAGFSREVEVCKTEGETIEKELVWSVDSQIKLPKRTKTYATLVVNQQEFDGRFTVTSEFWGRVIVNFYNKKDNNNYLRGLEHPVSGIFKGKEGFKINGPKVSYVSTGKCHFRFGVDQRVELKQVPLSDAES